MPVALYTFGQFILPSEHPDNRGFHDRNDANLAAVEKERPREKGKKLELKKNKTEEKDTIIKAVRIKEK